MIATGTNEQVAMTSHSEVLGETVNRTCCKKGKYTAANCKTRQVMIAHQSQLLVNNRLNAERLCERALNV
jgi:hypothetical protein